MMKISGLYHLFKRENLHNPWVTEYLFAPLYLKFKFSETQSLGISLSLSPNHQHYKKQRLEIFHPM